ncbi:MAG: tyrosine--tRNA ligase [Candidatus Diapherotrites archaeon]|uniref:tyrosine--tRNA ligase n=1 Tax=Candidatus Iainarchaeum sp. TaxID=3101447 RepID=A0A939C7M8_9ARCH|nr:tyrosine--tRNA ligase [Candidatus Diapherotrites archaeon]
MELEKRLALIQEVGEEIITLEDLRQLLEKKKKPIAYDGFEPSGNVHIAQGLLRAINVNKMLKAGCHFKMWVADWHAMANKKLGGNLDDIQTAGKYMIEVWKVAGLDTKKVEFLWASDFVKKPEYWKTVMQIAMGSTVKRIVRCSQIMGRSESEALSASQIFYPCMQAADIFHLEVDIAQLGLDQRKVNMLAREIGPKLGFWKPVAVHHHMLMGLQLPNAVGIGAEKEIAMKMSKSIPDSAIFMTDSEKEVERKISRAYCPEKQVQGNPVMEYCRFIVFEKNKKMRVERPSKFGGDVSFNSIGDLEAAFASGDLHPMDLKNATSSYLNEMLEPVRKHFSKGKAKELLERVEDLKVTR